MFCTHATGAIACASATCSAVALLTPRCRIRPCCWSAASVSNGSASEPGWGPWALPSRRLTTSSTSTPRSSMFSLTNRRRLVRYSELGRLLAGVSQKMLTQTLRSLERDRLVTRTATPTVPVTVSYELTDLGLSLHQTMRGIKTWAETHMDDVLANREAHDARAA